MENASGKKPACPIAGGKMRVIHSVMHEDAILPGSNLNLQPVCGQVDLQGMTIGVYLQVIVSLGEKLLKSFIIIGMFAVEQAEMLDVRPDGQLHGGEVAGMPPVFLRIQGVQQGILSVKNEQIRLMEEINECVFVGFRLFFMFCIC